MSASVRIQIAFNVLVFIISVQSAGDSTRLKITLCMAFDVLQGFYWFNYDVSEHIKHVPFSIVY